VEKGSIVGRSKKKRVKKRSIRSSDRFREPEKMRDSRTVKESRRSSGEEERMWEKAHGRE
jgi:hypothetical protein